MEHHVIKIQPAKNGKPPVITIDGVGFKGKTCELPTKKLQSILEKVVKVKSVKDKGFDNRVQQSISIKN